MSDSKVLSIEVQVPILVIKLVIAVPVCIWGFWRLLEEDHFWSAIAWLLGSLFVLGLIVRSHLIWMTDYYRSLPNDGGSGESKSKISEVGDAAQ